MMLRLVVTLVCVPLIYCTHGPSGDLFFELTSQDDVTNFKEICDDCFQEHTLSHTYTFFGVSYNKIFIGSNGYVTFEEGDKQYTPYPTVAEGFYSPPMIAPLFSDIDLRWQIPDSHLHWQETEFADRRRRAKGIAKKFFRGCPDDFQPTGIFIVNWDTQANYCDGPDSDGEGPDDLTLDLPTTTPSSGKRDIKPDRKRKSKHPIRRTADDPLGQNHPVNSFQLVLATDDKGNTFAIIHYHSELEWWHCWDYNKMLFSAGDECGFYFEDNNGGDMSMYYKGTNVNRKGRWVFKIDGNQMMKRNCELVGEEKPITW